MPVHAAYCYNRLISGALPFGQQTRHGHLRNFALPTFPAPCREMSPPGSAEQQP